MRTCPQCQNQCEETHKFCPSCGFPVGKVATTPDDPLIGRTLPGGYVILDLVGIGGMGRVYRAEQTNLGRTVAVKIIHPHLVGEENAAARFITEARAASRLNHPNSVGVIDFGKTEDGQLYLVMEFLRGKDLARVQYEEGPLSFRRIVSILRQVLAALSEAHHLGIIHRDLKPENIILEQVRTGGDFVKVVDFGLAKMKVEATTPSITSPGIVCGTPEYMSPEQGRGDPLDARSDLYAVGVIFYQLLTGRLPFEAESPTQVVLMHITETPTDPRTVSPERMIPSLLSDVCLMALAKEPNHRFGNADEFAEALADALSTIESTVPRALPGGGVKCPSCGASNPSTQKFCGECGHAIHTPPAVRAGQPTMSPPAPSVPPPPSNLVPIEPGTGRREIVVDRDRAQFPLEFVGREEDIAWLDDRLEDARSSLVGARIVGDVGMGKSRLLREFLEKVRNGGHEVVEIGPDPGWAEVGYAAVRNAIVTLADLPTNGGTTKDWSAAGAEARRGLADIFEHGSRGELSSDELRFAVAEALRWAIVRASERLSASGKRVILAVDDLHAIDGASRTALADAVGEPPLVPSLLVVTYPPGHDPGWPASTASARVLMGLAPGMVSRLLAGTSKPSSTIGGRGIAPLYVDQLLRFSREQGGRAPTRLADLIALRVERLPPDARRVLQAIAVYGDNADDGIIARLVTEGTNLTPATDVLEAAGMIEQSGMTFRCAHPLIRDVVLATIPAAVRRSLHATCAEIGEANGMPLEARALHEYSAQNTFQALILLEQVASRAAARGDLGGSISALRRGLDLARRELFRGELDDPMRAVLIFARKLGEVLTAAGAFTDAEGVLREALDMAGPSGSDRARVLGALAQVSAIRDRNDEAHRFLLEALELAFASGAHELLHSLEDLKKSIAV
ncbi:protein kinase [Labilithrix luteola]|uniref:non-specific serine/threonine protein kinase n=1 Tax=Labilithrix luteola TaxID=1391654 RepID=A0A0K1PR88_9BACT|nr:serine/threonine-protein kinase [Labilithrix luteola]AKU96037.1 protein kinase [Labilithrix luteola]